MQLLMSGRCRLKKSTIAFSTIAYSAIAISCGGRPVTFLSDHHKHGAAMTELLQELVSEMQKERLVQLGLAFQRSLGMDVLLAGGKKVCILMSSLDEIRRVAVSVRRKDLATRQERADEMLLTAKKGDPVGAMLYSLGKANLRWPLWRGGTKTQQDDWRKEILEAAAGHLTTRQERTDEMLLTAKKGDPYGAVLYSLGKAYVRWPLWRGGTKTQQDGWRKEILEAADRAQKASLTIRQERADEMRLTAKKGDPLGAMLYSLGKANLRWPLWRRATLTQKDGWRKEILETEDNALTAAR
jgi:hypothetical protein